jgi:iron complex outermembrane receptor protein
VRNVSDERIKTSAFNPGPHAIWLAQYQPPRTWGFNTGIDF